MSRWIAVRFGGQDDDDDVGHAAVLEDQIAQQIERGGARALAEAQEEQVGAHGMHVPALEGVVQALFFRAVVQNPGVLEIRIVAEQRLDQQLFGPADAVAHRADDRVLADDDPDVAREKQIGQRRQRVGDFVQGAGDRAAVFERAFDHQRYECFGRKRGELLGQHVRGYDLEGARRDELADFRPAGDVGERVFDLVDFREALEHGDQPAMLALRDLEIDDVVVEVVFARAGSDRHELFPRCVDQDRTKRADFGGDVNPGHGR
jgi:hypothetical protein